MYYKVTFSVHYGVIIKCVFCAELAHRYHKETNGEQLLLPWCQQEFSKKCILYVSQLAE